MNLQAFKRKLQNIHKIGEFKKMKDKDLKEIEKLVKYYMEQNRIEDHELDEVFEWLYLLFSRYKLSQLQEKRKPLERTKPVC